MPINSPTSPQQGVTQTRNFDIQLAIIESGSLRVFHLSAGDERVITVGATMSADIHFDSADISPIHFYFERLDDEVWIVPAYCVSGLRVNSTKVTMPQRLGSRAKVEFGSIVLDIEITHPNQALLRSHRRPALEGFSDDFEAIEDDEPTHQAWPTEPRPALERSVVTLMVPRQALASNTYPVRTSTALAVTHRPTERLSLLRTVPITQLGPMPLSATDETIRISRIRPIPVEDTTPAPSAPSHTPVINTVELASLKKTLYGVSPSRFGTDCPRLAPPRAQRCITQSLSSMTAARIPTNRRGTLYLIGKMARRRPLAALITAVVCAVVGALLVVFATGALMRAHRTHASKRLHSLLGAPSKPNKAPSVYRWERAI